LPDVGAKVVGGAAGAPGDGHAETPGAVHTELLDAGSPTPPPHVIGDVDGGMQYTTAAPGQIVRIVASDFHTCAALEDERVLCWGVNPSAENNLDVAHRSDTAEWVPWLRGAKELTSGRGHNCFLAPSGEARCYGINYTGSLGDGTTRSTGKPQRVALSSNKKAVSFGLGIQFSSALMEDGSVQYWGGWAETNLLPGTLEGLSDVTALSAAWHRGCALLRDQTVKCWTDYLVLEPTPAPVAELQGAVQISVSETHGCAVLASRELKCWSDGAASSVPGSQNVVSVAAGMYDTCAVLADGHVRCWHRSNGSLGEARDVPGVSEVKLLAGGSGHHCAVKRDDSVQCWGAGRDGQLGDGAGSDSSRPVHVLFPVE